jgi:transcriptional regulator with XRE-family HTH domain
MTSAYDQGTIPPIELRHRLRIAREAAGLEQSELADAIGVSRNTIGNIEKGKLKTPPRKIIINAWALACGVPVSWLINGAEPPAGPSGGAPTAPIPADESPLSGSNRRALAYLVPTPPARSHRAA